MNKSSMPIKLEYIWIDGYDRAIPRFKTMIIKPSFPNYNKVKAALQVGATHELPKWNYDGSSCEQAVTKDSEILLKPVFHCPNPFDQHKTYSENSFLVMCASYGYNDAGNLVPAKNNNYDFAKTVFDREAIKKEDFWFGLEQEYYLFDQRNKFSDQGLYYCASDVNSFYESIAEEHLDMCLNAGLDLSGKNAEVGPGQGEFQVGIVKGINAGHHLWVARFILAKLAGSKGLSVSFCW